MHEVTEQQLEEIKQRGGKVTRRNRKMPKKDKAAEVSAPPPVASSDVPLPSKKRVEPPTPTSTGDPQVGSLVEAQNQIMAHNTEMIRLFGEELKEIARNRTPVPWKLTVNRNKQGFIADLDLIPKISGA